MDAAIASEQTIAWTPAIASEQTIALTPAISNEQTIAWTPVIANEQTTAGMPAIANEQTIAWTPAIASEQTLAGGRQAQLRMYATTQAQTTEKRKGRNCQDKNSICNINDTSSSSDAQQKQIQCASKIKTVANSHQQEKIIVGNGKNINSKCHYKLLKILYYLLRYLYLIKLLQLEPTA